MADTKLGGIAVYEDDDGKAVWEFEGKVQSDIPLDTEAQDFAGAINELKKLSEQGGGDDSKPWARPSDWPTLPAPQDNQVIFLVTTAPNSSPFCSISTRPLDQYAFPENKGEYPEGLTISVNWGDGHISTAIRKTAKTLEWTNQFGQNGPNANNPAVSGSADNYYYDYTDQKEFWNPGGTKLDDGTVVFIVTVTINDPQNIIINFPVYSCALETHIGKNINIGKAGSAGNTGHYLQHVRAFGWQPSKNKDKQFSSYNSDTGVVSWNQNGIFTNSYVLKKIDATEPFTEIPDRMCSSTYVTIEINLSEAAKIGDGAFYDCFLFTDALDLPKCTEIGSGAFYNCTLTSVNAPSLIYLGEQAFYNCLALKEVKMASLQDVSARTFNSCKKLFSVDIPNMKSAGNSCFAGCNNLLTINAPMLESAEDYSFYHCFMLETFIAPNLSLVGSNAFNSCFGLKEFVCAEGTDLSKSGLNAAYLWYDNPILQEYRPKDIN